MKLTLKNEFEIKDLGSENKILGMEIQSDRRAGWLSISQQKYIENVL